MARVAAGMAAAAVNTQKGAEPEECQRVVATAIAAEVEEIPAAMATRPVATSAMINSKRGYDARSTIEANRRAREDEADDSYPTFLRRLRRFLLPEKFKLVGISKYDGKQDPKQWLRIYCLAVETARGDDDTKVLYFPMCMEQAPLTWLDTLERCSIDKWEDLKKAFTNNFAGALGRADTKMDLAQVKQKNGENRICH